MCLASYIVSSVLTLEKVLRDERITVPAEVELRASIIRLEQ